MKLKEILFPMKIKKKKNVRHSCPNNLFNIIFRNKWEKKKITTGKKNSIQNNMCMYTYIYQFLLNVHAHLIRLPVKKGAYNC